MKAEGRSNGKALANPSGRIWLGVAFRGTAIRIS